MLRQHAGSAARSPAALAVILAACVAVVASAAVPRDTAVELTATVSDSPASITLNWPPLSGVTATSVTVTRKMLGDDTWGTPATLANTAVTYTDSDVSPGLVYEYRVYRYRSDGVAAYGYLAAGIQAPAVHERGTAVVLVDATLAPLAAPEIAQFLSDLRGDGWRVVRHDVARTDSPPAVRALIQADYAADPEVRAVVILGAVPQPYSGYIAPDGHSDHYGAWPTDAYYADLTGAWTDTTVNTTSASDPRNRNVPGDGKFDQSYIPVNLAFEVGRVDLRNMTAFAAAGESATDTEARLLRRYLQKDHAWRHAEISVPTRGLVDDGFGYFSGEAFAASGWRNFASLAGGSAVSALDWFSTLQTNDYLLAYGCGGGSSTSASGVGSTANFASGSCGAVFTFLFGSYFGDWGYTNNFLRAPLAASGYALTCGWAGRPHWFIHPMGMGETIGACARMTQNNSGLYSPVNYGGRSIHVGLMGDPTLRLHVVAPPRDAQAASSGPWAVVSWTPSADAAAPGFEGYYVYSAETENGPWTRLTPAPIAGPTYSDALAVSPSVYAVRAVRLWTSNSGTYENLSQAAFAPYTTASNTAPTISAIADQTTNEDQFSAPVSFTVGDAETPADALTVAAQAADTRLVPFGNIVFGGSGAARTLKVVGGPNLYGATTITVTVSDGALRSSASFRLTINPVNDAPVASGQSISTAEDTPKATTLYATDVEGSPLTYAITQQPAHGTLSGTPPTVTYTPAQDYNGSDSFKFRANDGQLNSNEATVTITITPVNDPPVAYDQPATTDLDVPVVIILTGYDVEGAALTYSVVTQPTKGLLSGAAPNLLYTPFPGVTGDDVFTFRCNDGELNSNVATVTVHVLPPPTTTTAAPTSTTSTSTTTTSTSTSSSTTLPAIDFVIDNSSNPSDRAFAPVSGTWSSGTSLAGKWGADYRYAATATGAATARARWSTAALPAGTYQVYAWWPAYSNRSMRAPFVVKDGAAELATVRVDQTVGGGQWAPLGVFAFAAGGHAVELHNGQSKVLSAEQYVSADAVRFVYLGAGISTTTTAPPITTTTAGATTTTLPPTDVTIDNLDGLPERKFQVVSGSWTTASSLPDRFGADYRYAATATGAATARARWSTTLLAPGTYEVRAWWPAYSNRSTRAPFVVKDGATELATVRVDQTVGGGQWQLLGVFAFTSGSAAVELHNSQTKVLATEAFVSADAVRFLRVPGAP